MRSPKRIRIYRLLLRLFPREFRTLNGSQMERLFLDMSSDWEERHGSLGFLFWTALVWDTVRSATAERLSETHRAIRSEMAQPLGEQMSALWSDVRLALRQLKREPSYAFMIILLMTIGIAGNAAVFRIFNGLFLKPLPFDSPEQLVDLDETAPAWDLEFLSIAYRDFDAWRAENRTFQSMAVMSPGGGNFSGDGAPQRVSYLSTTHDIDDVLAIEPLLGRFYGPEEDQPDGARVALLSEGFWRQEFAGDPNVVGKTVSLNGFAVEVIGVLPPEARFLREVDMWLPLRQSSAEWRGWGLSGIGRLRPGVTIDQALQDLLPIHRAVNEGTDTPDISTPVVNSLRDRHLGDYRLGSGFLLGAVGLVLLIACANIAGLMFVRSLARGQEMSVRLALGAPRGRIVRQLLTEGVVLGVIGGATGAFLGILGSNAIVTPMADQFPQWVTFDLDARFLLFTLAVTMTAAVLFGLAPALRASSAGSASTGSQRSTGGRVRRRWMGLLVMGEVAAALALLVVGGLAVEDVRQLGKVNPGFEAEGLLSYSVTLPSTRYSDDQARLAFVDEYLPRLEALPGVESASVASTMPLSGHWGFFLIADGAPPRTEEEGNPVVLNRIVSPSYFETAGVEFVAGRPFDAFDGRDEGSAVLVVNERFVETHLSHLDDPIGAQVTGGTEIGDDPTWITVIGVTRNVKHYGLDEEMRPGVYQPFQQRPLSGFNVALRVRGDIQPVVAQARAITTDMDLELPVYGVQTMTDKLADSLWTRRAMSWLIGAFSTVALMLAIAGIYGVISYSVSQRAKEISIRMAMGARREDVLTQVLRQGMRLVGIGVVLGILLSLAGAGQVSGILVGIDPTEPLVYIGVTVLLVLVAAVANYLPARRAASLDPMRALRRE